MKKVASNKITSQITNNNSHFIVLRDVADLAVLASPRQPGSLLIAALSLGQMVTVVQQLTVTVVQLEVLCEFTHDQIEKGNIKKELQRCTW